MLTESASHFFGLQGYALPVYATLLIGAAMVRIVFEQEACWAMLFVLTLFHGLVFYVGSPDLAYVVHFWHPRGPFLHDFAFGDVFIDVGERVVGGGHTHEGLPGMGEPDSRPAWAYALPVMLAVSVAILLPRRVKWLAVGVAVGWLWAAGAAVEAREGAESAESAEAIDRGTAVASGAP